MRKATLVFAFCTILSACEPATNPVTVHSDNAIPDRLSDWGVVFTDGRHLKLNDGVIPYDLNTPLFDNAFIGKHVPEFFELKRKWKEEGLFPDDTPPFIWWPEDNEEERLKFLKELRELLQ